MKGRNWVRRSTFSGGSPLEVPTSITVAPTSLNLPSGTSQLTATIKNTLGTTLNQVPDSWASDATGVATVSQTGLVTEVSQNGTAHITATKGSLTSNACTVSTSAGGSNANIFAMDFETMTATGPFTFTGSPNGQSAQAPYQFGITVISDPTPRASGKVMKIDYFAASDGSSTDDILVFQVPSPLAFSSHLWIIGKVFIPTGTGNWSAGDNRKLIRFNDGGNNSPGNGVDVILHRHNPSLNLAMTAPYTINGVNQNGDPDQDAGAILLNDTWTILQVHVQMDSGKNTQDGKLELYVGGSSTPSHSITTPMTFASVGNTTDCGQPFIAWGCQITGTNGAGSYADPRYWDDLGISTTMINP